MAGLKTKGEDMDERLTDEQLQAIRERQEAVKAAALKEHEARQALEQDGSAADKHYALLNAEFEWEDARREAEAFADEDIEALLAHIDALEAELEAATFAVDPPLDNKPTVIRRFRLTEVSSEDEAE